MLLALHNITHQGFNREQLYSLRTCNMWLEEIFTSGMIKAFGVYECARRRSNFYVGGLTKKTKTVQYLTPFPLWKFTSWKWKKHVVPDGYLLFFISGSSINSSACNYLFKAWRIFFVLQPPVITYLTRCLSCCLYFCTLEHISALEF